jgi:diguanylate cyclase (GGDEF)-like protein
MPEIAKTEPELALELKSLSSKDFHLWSITILLGLVLTIGFVALIAPNLVWRSGPLQVDGRFLPQLFFGFIVLIAMFNVYLLDQKRRLSQTRDRLIRKLMASETADSELCDPLTKLFSRNYLELWIPQETARADRDNRSIAFTFVSVNNLKSVIARFGTVAGDHLLMVFAQLLKATLRGSDILSRYGADEFLLVLPDTAEPQAERALTRLQAAVDRWNQTTAFPYKVEIQTGCACYTKGMKAAEVILEARQSVGPLRPTLETAKVLIPAIQ